VKNQEWKAVSSVTAVSSTLLGDCIITSIIPTSGWGRGVLQYNTDIWLGAEKKNKQGKKQGSSQIRIQYLQHMKLFKLH
jgi:hypothetical protein